MEKTIKVCRLVTGEFVVATVSNNVLPGKFDFQDPLIFEIRMMGDKQYEMPVMPLIPLGKPGDTVTLNERDISFWVHDPTKHIIDRFEAIINPSAIVIPNKAQLK